MADRVPLWLRLGRLLGTEARPSIKDAILGVLVFAFATALKVRSGDLTWHLTQPNLIEALFPIVAALMIFLIVHTVGAAIRLVKELKAEETVEEYDPYPSLVLPERITATRKKGIPYFRVKTWLLGSLFIMVFVIVAVVSWEASGIIKSFKRTTDNSVPAAAPSPSLVALASPSPEQRTPEAVATPDIWESQYNARKSLFEMPDKTLQYYPPDWGVPVAIRCRLEYRPNKPWPTSLIVYIPDTPFGMRSKEVLASARFVIDNYNDIVNSIVADAGSDKANEMFLRKRVIKGDRVVFYHSARITPDDVFLIVNLRGKEQVVVERYGPKSAMRN